MELDSISDTYKNYDADLMGKLNQIYLMIISRYKNVIENAEELSVAQLPTLVTPKAQEVLLLASQICSDYKPYNYTMDFESAAINAFKIINDKIDEIALSVQFWFTPQDTLHFMAGDKTDKAIVLCSLLITLGNPSSKVVIVSKEEHRGIYVYAQLNKECLLFNFVNNTYMLFDNKESLLEHVKIHESDAAYEFNDQSYADIA